MYSPDKKQTNRKSNEHYKPHFMFLKFILLVCVV